MKSGFVDTNIFLRFLLGDNKDQAKIARKYFDDAVYGKRKLYSSAVVFLEIYWVLGNVYGHKKMVLKNSLLEVLGLNVEFLGGDVLDKAVSNMEAFNYDLEDAINFYTAKNMGIDEFVTFDKKLQKVWGKG